MHEPRCGKCNIVLIEVAKNGVVSLKCPRCGWVKEARAADKPKKSKKVKDD